MAYFLPLGNLGHSSLDMTRRYAHLAPGHLRSAIKHVDIGLAQAGGIPEADKGDGHLLNTGKILQLKHQSKAARHRPVAAKETRSRGCAPRPYTHPTPNPMGVAVIIT